MITGEAESTLRHKPVFEAAIHAGHTHTLSSTPVTAVLKARYNKINSPFPNVVYSI